MSNHYHLIVRLKPEEAAGWSDDEVLNRWTALFRGPLLVQRYRNGAPLTAIERDTVRATAAVFRTRLASLSWFMKCLNEPIARQANAEDGCTGHFWEARFSSQPLCSERALLTAMAYVDLNPVRAKIARTPEQSDYTSVRVRVRRDDLSTTLGAVSRMLGRGELHHFDTPIRALMPFNSEKNASQAGSVLPIREFEYLRLVDTTGRLVARGKRGRIDSALEPILVRLGLSAEQWIHASTTFKQSYRNGDLGLKAAK